MLITVRGSVGMDPMKVPLAASMATGRDSAFEQVLRENLDQSSQSAEPVDATAAQSAPEAEATPPTDEPVERASDEAPAAERALHDEPVPANDDVTSPAVATIAPEPEIRRGEAVRQDTAGKGTDSPRTSSARSDDALLAAFVQQAMPSSPPATLGAGPAVTAPSVKAIDAPTRGLGVVATKGNAPLQAPATAATYRTASVHANEQLEAARDSVFKQILMKLNDDGGEMRLRLEPPDLGELDLRLVVEGGNRLNLTIAAERPEITQLLQRHLDELTQTLQAAGLEVAGAHVQTRSEFAQQQREQAAAAESGATDAADDVTEPLATRARYGGYVSATGLDFWA